MIGGVGSILRAFVIVPRDAVGHTSGGFENPHSTEDET
jgi:hypothetical protein